MLMSMPASDLFADVEHKCQVRCSGWRARCSGAFSTRRNCPTRARRRAPSFLRASVLAKATTSGALLEL